MTTRRAMTPARMARIILHELERQGVYLRCAVSGEPIKPTDRLTAEHMVAFALGGADDDGEDNVRPALRAAAIAKTKGTAGTGRRGDTANIARAKRLANGGKKRRPGPQGRNTLQSRGFEKPATPQKIPSRKFGDRHRPLRNRRTETTA